MVLNRRDLMEKGIASGIAMTGLIGTVSAERDNITDTVKQLLGEGKVEQARDLLIENDIYHTIRTPIPSNLKRR